MVVNLLPLYWYHKVLASNRSARDLMESMREEKEQLEQELAAIKSVASRREADRRAEVREFTTWVSACALLDTPIRLHLKTAPKSRPHVDD